MRNKNLDESLQTAARDLVETPDYLEDLVMWVYESKGRVPKSELIGDSMCPKSVRKYLKDGGTIKELLKEAQEAAICRMSEAEECICMQNVQLARLFLKTSKSELEKLDIYFSHPFLSVTVTEFVHMKKILDEQKKMTKLVEEDEEVLRRLHFYFG